MLLFLPIILVAISSLYYFLFFKKEIKKNIIWLMLTVILSSLIFSISFSMSDRSGFDDFFLNLLQFILLLLCYAFLLLGLHYVLVSKGIIWADTYFIYVLIFSFFSFFLTIIYYCSLTFIFGIGS